MKRTTSSGHIPHFDPDVHMYFSRHLSVWEALHSFLLYVILLFTGATASAQWSTVPSANNRVCFAPGAQIIPKSVSDGAGGVIITWADKRAGQIESDIYAQRINSSGVTQWTLDGIGVVATTVSQNSPVITGDGEGGAIIAWNQNPDVYAQRIDANGIAQWQTNGIAVLNGIAGQANPRIIGDGNGGAIIVWTDYRAGFGNSDIYAQRVNSQGIVQWTTDGVAVCAVTGAQTNPSAAVDGSGGVIIAWEDKRGTDTTDIYAQRINASGIPQWTPNGVVVCVSPNVQSSPDIIGDGAGNAIIAWQDLRSFVDYDIYAQRIDATGAAKWTANGIAICNATGDQESLTGVRDGSGGVIISWEDNRASQFASDIYAQRISSAGVVNWTSQGVLICNASLTQINVEMVRSGAGGAIIVWQDNRNPGADVYAQRIDSVGTVRWAANGVAISNAVSTQGSPVIAIDGTGGAIVTWDDRRSGEADIYAQRVDSLGVLGSATPVITEFADVPNDQGGEVKLTWSPSNRDILPSPTLQDYRVFSGSSPTSLNLVRTVSATQQSSYSVFLPTSGDSGSLGTPWTYVKIRARTAGTDFWDSDIDSAYSVDNLAPAPPTDPQITTVAAGTFRLQWNRNVTDPDVEEYRVHRSTINGFLIADSTRIASTPDTSIVDSPPASEQYYYRITTVDIHGNEGLPTAQVGLPTGVDEEGMPMTFVLGQNYPNPFNPSATIQFDIPQAEFVTLKVYTLLGQEVATLVNEVRPAGKYAEQFDASGLATGVYMYRLAAGSFTATKKLVLVR